MAACRGSRQYTSAGARSRKATAAERSAGNELQGTRAGVEPSGSTSDTLLRVTSEDDARVDSVTRGFLFSDLRGYTGFVERHGAAAAVGLLTAYRELVRAEVDRFDGAEIRTEGDSFYVVFDSVAAAVRCGLGIATAAAAASEGSERRIDVGIGIHAGETIETTEGYVGSPVNIAARVCALAAAGEVLVTETVRSLTQTLLPVRFVPRGRRKLKGIEEAVALFAVEAVGAMDERGPGARRVALWRDRRAQIAAGVAAALALGAIGWSTLRQNDGLAPARWKVGLDMPLSGDAAQRGKPIREGVLLALTEANASGELGDARVALDARDDAGNDPTGQVPARGKANARVLIADPTVIAMVGPASSKVAAAQIPITNDAGLLQCSPANTAPGLTKPRDGALDLRASHPTRINYVRLAPADDIQGPASASYAFHELGARSALVVDDGEDFGRLAAEQFDKAFEDLGGQTVRRTLNPGSSPASVLDSLSRSSGSPQLVFFGGFTDGGAPQLRRSMVARGYAKVPLLSWDGIYDGSSDDMGSYIQRTGRDAVGTYSSQPSIGPIRADFEESFRRAYGVAPDEYTAAAYACTQVILQAFEHALRTASSPSDLREAIRQYAVDSKNRFPTALGTVGFDANGDSLQQVVTLRRVGAPNGGTTLDWVIDRQQDFGPAP
jgi:branched-chain amino acid transport system substrate-binding protein